MRPEINQVWMSESTGNFFRVDEIEGEKVSVTRLGYRREDGSGAKSHKPFPETYCFALGSFPTLGRIVAHNAERFEQWLN
jgi:hypothetical protein